jgi:hypothetical protein
MARAGVTAKLNSLTSGKAGREANYQAASAVNGSDYSAKEPSKVYMWRVERQAPEE